jgi:hypothetical protein
VAATLDLDGYRREAEQFVERIDREYYLHLAGHKPELDLAQIYAEHAGLFSTDAVAWLRELATQAEGEEERRRRYLLQFAVDGLLGEATKAEAEESARLEATLEVAVDGRSIPYRQVQVEQANEADGEVRATLEAERNRILDEKLNPLYRAALERVHAICGELGWPSYADAYAELRGLDFERLANAGRAFIGSTEDGYAPLVDPLLAEAELPALGELRRSDLARFFRAPALDRGFPAERMVAVLAETLSGLGLDLEAQGNVHLDTEQRPTKSPRAFCAPTRVPEEIYLVISPVGGREDFEALFHEGGHTEHYANTDAALPFEFRHLGDNGVTESFAFLLEHLTEDPHWLRSRLPDAEPEAVAAQSRAVRLMFLRRYFAKLGYELELHGGDAGLEGMRERYASLLGAAIRVDWPTETWLADVDEGFYVACYLRAWALETHWRGALRERFGERWFEQPEAGEWLREVWSQGQRLSAEELLGSTLGEPLDFGRLAADLDG